MCVYGVLLNDLKLELYAWELLSIYIVHIVNWTLAGTSPSQVLSLEGVPHFTIPQEIFVLIFTVLSHQTNGLHFAEQSDIVIASEVAALRYTYRIIM